jgi:hypothetical protein
MYLRRLPAGKIERCFAKFFMNVAFPFLKPRYPISSPARYPNLAVKDSKVPAAVRHEGPSKGYYLGQVGRNLN